VGGFQKISVNQGVLEQSASLLLWNDQFAGTILNNDRYRIPASGFTASQGATAPGAISINDTSAFDAVNAKFSALRTCRSFPLWMETPTSIEFTLGFTGELDPGSADCFWGIGSPLNNDAGDGCWFRVLNATPGNAATRQLQAFVQNTASGLVQSIMIKQGAQLSAFANLGQAHRYRIEVRRRDVTFQVDDEVPVMVVTDTGQTTPTPAQSNSAQIWAGVNNPAASGSTIGRRVDVYQIGAYSRGIVANKPWGHALCAAGANAVAAQPGSTPAQLANWVNNTAPTNATLLNNAASYTTLGGQFNFVANATNETDWVLFSWSNPVSQDVVPGRVLHVTGFKADMFPIGAAVAQQTIFQWGLGASSGASLVTADSQATMAMRRLPAGLQSFGANAVSALPVTLDMTACPIIVPPSERLNIILKQINGAATASLNWRGLVTVLGYFE
jgi:hypothetical protein